MTQVEALERRLLFAAGDLVGVTRFGIAGGVDRIRDLVIRPDGRIYGVGDAYTGTQTDLGLIRFNAGGGVDNTFGTNGRLELNLGSSTDQGQRVSLQANGAILVGGSNGTQAVVARFTPDGIADTAFSTDGLVELPQLVNVAGVGQIAGNIVVGGTTPGGEFAVVRLDNTGAVDTNFGSGGIVTTTFNGGATARDMISTGSNLVIVGERGGSVAMARVTNAGMLDTSFGTGGQVLTANGRGMAVAAGSGGALYVAGVRTNDAAVFRYTAAGALDTTFDTDGVVTFNVAADDEANDIGIDASGRLLIGGTSTVGQPGARAFLARLSDAGALDTAFSTDGIAQTGGTTAEEGRVVGFGNDGRYLLGGLSQGDMALWRFESGGGSGGGTTDTTPPTAVASAENVEPNGETFYTFDVIYTDNSAIFTNSIGDGDVRVLGPGGFNQAASLLTVSEPTNGTPRIATYFITPPGGTWDVLDVGTYTISMNGLEVRDVAGNFIPAGAIGTFTVGNISTGETILGTEQNDTIVVVQTPGSLSVRINGVTTSRPLNSVVSVFGFGGDDRIFVQGTLTALLFGGDGNDRLWGGAGNDELDGGEGSDRLNGRGGDDTYVFQSARAFQKDTVVEVEGEGTDTLDFTLVAERITADLTRPVDPIAHYRRHVYPGRRDMFANFENINGGFASDIIRGNDSANVLNGGAGDDVLEGMAGNDQLIGDVGDDRYVFGDSAAPEVETITELEDEGTDTIDMRRVSTAVFIDLGGRELAWQQNRSIRLGSFMENGWGGTGHDFITGSSRSGSVLNGGPGNDTLIGGPFMDFIYGDDGDDLIRGLEGDDTLRGGPGEDRVDGGAGTNAIFP